MSLDSLLFVLALVAVAAVNLLLPWLRRRAETARRAPPQTGDEATGEGERSEVARGRVEWGGAGDEARDGGRDQEALAGAPAARPGIRAGAASVRHGPLGSLAQARQGIVLRAILGPCRAQDAFDGR